jgi:dTDP-glucose 4,6-dehydratase
MKVLITGGAGFLGSHLCDRFINEGHEVWCVDSLVTGRRSNIAHLQPNAAFHFVEADVAALRAADFPEIHQILHFACPASPPEYIAHPLDTIRACTSGTQLLLDLARDRGARFLVASTSEVYGDPAVHPQREDYWGNVNPIGVRAVYDEGKRYSEMLTALYRRDFNVDTAIVRIFNTYGPRMAGGDGRVIPNLVMQALRGESMTVYGDGSQTRSFCFYSDLIEGIVRLLRSSHAGPVNIGNPHEFTILELARTIDELLGTTSVLEHRPLPSDDPTRRRPDISRARELLGWEPTVELRVGLGPTIEWFRQELEQKVAS